MNDGEKDVPPRAMAYFRAGKNHRKRAEIASKIAKKDKCERRLMQHFQSLKEKFASERGGEREKKKRFRAH